MEHMITSRLRHNNPNKSSYGVWCTTTAKSRRVNMLGIEEETIRPSEISLLLYEPGFTGYHGPEEARGECQKLQIRFFFFFSPAATAGSVTHEDQRLESAAEARRHGK